MANKLGHALERGLSRASKTLGYIACGVLGAMLLIYTFNVVGRFVFNRPLLGADEIVDLGLGALVSLALSYTALNKGHVRIDLITSKLPKRSQAIIDSITSLLGTGFWAVIAYLAGLRGWIGVFGENESTFILGIPLAPFMFVMAVGCFMLSLQLLIEFCHVVTQAFRSGGE